MEAIHPITILIPPEKEKAPTISYVTGSCHSGSTVIVVGSNFSSAVAENKVKFGDLDAVIKNATPTSLTVITPKLSDEVTSVDVRVIKSGLTSNIKNIPVDIEKNKIAQYECYITVVTEPCYFGSTVVITGVNFSATITDQKVMFGNLEAEIVKATATSLEVITPKLGDEITSVDVKVIKSDKDSNIKNVKVDVEKNKIANYECYITTITAPCFYGSMVVITGLRFSPTITDQKVLFGDLKAEIVKATATSLTVITPKLANVVSVDVKVVKSGKDSNIKTIGVDKEKNEIATYNWTTHTVKSGVIYKTGQFNLFGAARRIHILDVTLNKNNTLGIGVTSSLKTTNAICADYNAVAGINAGYFPMGSTDKDPYIRINGQTIQAGHQNVDALFTNAALLIQGNVATVRKLGSSTNLNKVASEIPVSQAENIIVCGPMLITNGVIENMDMNRGHNSSATARTGLGVSEDGKRVLMVVIDYDGGMTGMNTGQLAIVLHALGAENAMNFDGGGSSTMFVNGQGSVNTSQRKVHSIIYVK